MSEVASQRPSSRNSNIGKGLFSSKESLINHKVERQISMFDNTTKNQSVNFS